MDVHGAVHAIDELVRRHRPSCVRFLTIDAGWRANEPTEKQIDVLRRRGIPTPSGLTRGQALDDHHAGPTETTALMTMTA